MPRPRPMPFQHARSAREGVAFVDYLDQLCGRNRLLRQRQLAFIHEWDVLVDELGRRPTVREYAERWRAARSSVYALLDEFRSLFVGQDDPTALCQELWHAVSAQQDEAPFGWVDVERARVVPAAAS